MSTAISKRNRNNDTIDTLNIKGEEFVLMKKEYLKELTTLMNSFVDGGGDCLRRKKQGVLMSFLFLYAIVDEDFTFAYYSAV